jgi:hypothetical protein
MIRMLILLSGLLLAGRSTAQRMYTVRSVLSTGDWYKLAVTTSGVHRIDADFITKMGIRLPIASSSIRIFGHGGGMLPEDNRRSRPDDLMEHAIRVEDGGDGSFGTGDQILFFAPGPDRWEMDSSQRRFFFRKHLYTKDVCYFLTFQGQGLRVGTTPNYPSASATIDRFDERQAIEIDSLNFLSSGREWFGDEFGTGPGRQTSKTYTLSSVGLIPGTDVTVATDLLARSLGQPARFDVSLNGVTIQRLTPAALTGIQYEPVATKASSLTAVRLVENRLQLGISFTPGSVNAQGWLDRLVISWKRRLEISQTSPLSFRHFDGISAGAVAEYVFASPPTGLQLWDVSVPLQPLNVPPLAGNPGRFRNDVSRIREHVAFVPALMPLPRYVGRINNQDLHRPQFPAMIIVTTDILREEAERLAAHHRQRENLSSIVVEVGQIWNEFSSGTPDPSAIRDFVKMFYDRAGSDTARRPKYLLLFGDGTFDPIGRLGATGSFIPAWQSPGSLDPLSTYTTDDFYAMLDDDEDINDPLRPGLLDIGVGRIPAGNVAEARTYVDKVSRYHAAASLGPWRTQISLVADDEDQNVHLNDAEFHASTIAGIDSVWNLGKTYLDAYRQESGAGGSRYPQVNAAINSRIFGGTLIWNYSGHGGSRRLAQEAILDEDMVSSWKNRDRLPLFITATCDFAPFDNPLERSIGEQILLGSPAGGIALMTTTRLVFAYSNRVMNNNYLKMALNPRTNGGYRTLGEAVQASKNLTAQTSGDIINNRKFTLLGDPALTLGIPTADVRLAAIDGRPLQQFTDTLRALNRYAISGEVTDAAGRRLTDFNGYVYPSLYDKEQTVPTLANDPGSQVTSFRLRRQQLYNGKVRVVDGRFSFPMIVPRDIDYATGLGRFSFYAEDGQREAAGQFGGLYVGGLGNGLKNDGAGPEIKAWLNDRRFVNGGMVDEQPVLILQLKDSTAINTSGTGIGHDITAVIDGDTRGTIVLNEYYEADPDSERSGTLRFQLPTLTEGMHTILIRAWDVFNNSNEYLLECRVVKRETLKIDRVLNYPNPFTTSTRFWFEHNRPGDELRVTVQVMTITGKIVKTIDRRILTEGNRSEDLEWNGRDDVGALLGRGVYLYRLRVISSDGQQAEKLEKLLIL